MIDKHTIALISIIGCSLDLLGAMYLAYDLLGGEHGPLRTLTRAVTYGGVDRDAQSAHLRLATMEKSSRHANFEELWTIKSQIF